MTTLSQKSINNSLTRANSAEIAGFAMPSNTYEDFTVGASASEHIAEYDGYIYVKTSNAVQWIGIGVYSGEEYSDWNYYIDQNNSTLPKTCMAPVKKGLKFFVGYPNGTTFECARFFFLEGKK